MEYNKYIKIDYLQNMIDNEDTDTSNYDVSYLDTIDLNDVDGGFGKSRKQKKEAIMKHKTTEKTKGEKSMKSILKSRDNKKESETITKLKIAREKKDQTSLHKFENKSTLKKIYSKISNEDIDDRFMSIYNTIVNLSYKPSKEEVQSIIDELWMIDSKLRKITRINEDAKSKKLRKKNRYDHRKALRKLQQKLQSYKNEWKSTNNPIINDLREIISAGNMLAYMASKLRQKYFHNNETLNKINIIDIDNNTTKYKISYDDNPLQISEDKLTNEDI